MSNSLDLAYPTSATLRKALKPSSMYGKTAGGLWLPFLVGSDGSVTITDTAEVPVTAATLSAVASLATSQQGLAANTARKGVFAYNTDANACLLKYGTTASATSFTVRLVQYAYWEMPQPIYTGRIDLIWEADGAGSLFLTEV